MKKLVVIGAGPHSKVILDILLQLNEYEIVGLTDQTPEGRVLGFPVLGSDDILPDLYRQGVEYAFVALGNNYVRKKVFLHAKEIGFAMANAVSPQAIISPHASVGEGVAIMPGAVINAGTSIGDGSIINTNASVDHDCRIGNFVHIAPGCAISGSTSVGEESFLGTGSRVIDKLKIGKKVLLGAGGVVVKDIPDSCEAVGIPAKVIKRFD